MSSERGERHRCQVCHRDLVACGPLTKQRFQVCVRLMDGMSAVSSCDFVELGLCALCASTQAVLELAAELLENSGGELEGHGAWSEAASVERYRALPEDVTPVACSWCHGEGFQDVNICTECKGAGRV